MSVRVLHGDMLAILPTLDANSFDAVVTDPPYHLTSIVERFGSPTAAPAKGGKDGAFARASRGFMGKVWDGGDVAFRPETWAAVLRVLKPGGHMVCFGGTRTQHRMVCAIEDAGFEIKDTLCWLYGTGFPKSHDVSKAIDKAAGAVREVSASYERSGRSNGIMGEAVTITRDITAPATPEAAQWQGWGSALKPAHEPIVLARKPLSEKSIAANVLKHSVGGINIDGCRVEGAKPAVNNVAFNAWRGMENRDDRQMPGQTYDATQGRFPANVLHDGSDEVMTAFAAFGDRPSKGGGGSPASGFWGNAGGCEGRVRDDSGTAARFFYSAKSSAADRAGSKHPTVKPVALIEWLVRLITPPGGKVLDPFAGSGTTGEACMKLGFDCTMIDLEADHVRDIQHRIKRWSGLDAPLFAEGSQ